MKVIDWLHYYPKIDELIKLNKRELREINSRNCVSINAQVITGMPHSSGVSKQTEDKAFDIIERRNELLENIEELERKNQYIKLRLDIAFSKMTDIQKRIVELRYFEWATFKKIKQILGKDRMTIWRQHDKAIKIITEVLNNENVEQNNAENS